MYVALFYETVENYVERRQPFRELHLAYAKTWQREGKLVLAGATKPDGALLVFKGASVAEVEGFATNDPYVKNGLISKWTAREWVVVIGN
ncbi:MAG TPA: YciI-like protein [Vicinamibacterales bacterium]|jgi:hypothetical protein